MRTASVLWGVLLCATLAAGGAASGEKGREKVTPVLAPDPAVMKVVNSLGEGEGAKLPRFKVAGDIKRT